MADDLSYLQYCGLSANEIEADLASWVPNWDHITRTETTAPAPWREAYEPGSYDSDCLRHLRQIEFHILPHLNMLRIRGQLRSGITGVKSQKEWLEVHNYKMTISKMYESFYPCWKEGATKWGVIQQPVQRLVALHLTLLQCYGGWLYKSSISERTETAAGFCYSTSSRLESVAGTSDPMSNPSLPMLLETLASEFENQPETFCHPEQYKNDYLAFENESLHQRVFFETSSGRFGIGPVGAQEGDMICNIYGLGFPLLLRKVDSHYLIVERCFVLGCMAGQGYDESKAEILEIW